MDLIHLNGIGGEGCFLSTHWENGPSLPGTDLSTNADWVLKCSRYGEPQ